jgi:two-component system, chemotaxis family, sensor kinase CheA
MTSSEDAFLKKLRAAFVGEAHEQIERISEALTQLPHVEESSARQQIIENTFRELHNMKGSARAVNLLNLESVCQSLEDIFSQLKRSERDVSAKLMDALLEVVDSVSEFLAGLQNDESSGESKKLLELLDLINAAAATDPETSRFPATSTGRATSTNPTASTVQASSTDRATSTDPATPTDRATSTNPTASASQPEGSDTPISPKFAPLSDWGDDIPIFQDVPPAKKPEAANASESAEAILNSFVFDSSWQDSGSAGALFEGIPVSPSSSSISSASSMNAVGQPNVAMFEATSPMMAPSVADPNRETIRIPAARFDELLMRAEDMLSLKIMSRQHNSDLNNIGFKFDSYARELSKIYADVRAARQMIDRDQASAEQIFIESVLSRVIEFLDAQQQQMSALGAQLNSLQTLSLNDFRVASNTVDTFLENTKKLLMMPASTMLELMPKMVRDLARELEKEVDLTITGNTIQLDKRVLAQVKDPLIHILRNSIDHGIERPEVRVQAGKSPRGSLKISVMPQEGNTVEIVVTDDGAGINIAKVKEIGIKNSLIDNRQAEELTDAEAIALIFQSSFSTSSAISEISGRGLGLAIAKENIEKLGGRLIVESRKGLGTSFRIKLPVTVATFRGVLIRCSDETLIVPTSDMERLLKVKHEQIKTTDAARSIFLDGREVPLLRLDDVLELPASKNNPTQLLAMVLRHSDALCAFEIDEVLEEQEVLVKKLSKPLVRVRNVAGVTVLGSGKPAAILNVRDLVQSAARLSSLKIQRPKPLATQAKKRILVVDDTITARILMKNILESAGYIIKTANDGTDALKLLEKEQFDMLVTDIEMPKMNGIQLTEAVRKGGKKLPIILVTSMTDQQFRDQGTEAGADAFFVKSSFDQNNLLDVIKRLI